MWPCCVQPLEVFIALGTQWRMAPMGGLLGLDYGAVMPVLRLMGVPRKDWTYIFEDLRVLERAAREAVG